MQEKKLIQAGKEKWPRAEMEKKKTTRVKRIILEGIPRGALLLVE